MAVVLGARTDQRPPVALTEAELLQPIGNTLLALGAAVDDYEAITAKRARIVAKLDDPTIQATAEQRAEAEARASALHYEADRHRKEARRRALAFVRLWGEQPDSLQEFIRDEAFPTHWYDNVAAFIGREPTLIGMEVWRLLIVGRDERKEQIDATQVD